MYRMAVTPHMPLASVHRVGRIGTFRILAKTAARFDFPTPLRRRQRKPFMEGPGEDYRQSTEASWPRERPAWVDSSRCLEIYLAPGPSGRGRRWSWYPFHAADWRDRD